MLRLYCPHWALMMLFKITIKSKQLWTLDAFYWRKNNDADVNKVWASAKNLFGVVFFWKVTCFSQIFRIIYGTSFYIAFVRYILWPSTIFIGCIDSRDCIFNDVFQHTTALQFFWLSNLCCWRHDCLSLHTFLHSHFVFYQ